MIVLWRKENRSVGRHRGRFKWKKYSRYKGNLKIYWTAKDRTTERHRRDALSQ